MSLYVRSRLPHGNDGVALNIVVSLQRRLALKKTTILVRDAYGELTCLLRRLLPSEYMVLRGETEAEVIRGVKHFAPDLVFLDALGLDICVLLREMEHTFPIIVVGSEGDTEEVVRALDLGADDYVPSSFSLNELAARVRALLRRSQGVVLEGGVLQSQDGYLRMHVEQHQVFAGEQVVALTKTEFAFLHYLMAHAEHVVTNRTLLKMVWGPQYGKELDYNRVYVRQIRRKLEPDPSHPIYIRTVPGVGYIFRSACSSHEQVKDSRSPASLSV